MIHVCFLIRQLNEGGAQRQLVELVTCLDRSRFRITVVSLYSGGRFGEEIGKLTDVQYVTLKKAGRWDLPRIGWQLPRHMRRLRPDVLHGYLPIANVLCALLKPFLPGTRLVWGIRASAIDWSQHDWVERLLFKLQWALSPCADLIIFNSNAGSKYHRGAGFASEKMVVIPNGINSDRFFPDPDGRSRVRAEWGVDKEETLIGLVGRLDPMKDHSTFLMAAARLTRDSEGVRFVCVGDGPAEYRRQLFERGERIGLASRVVWAGSRDDMTSVYSALDVATSSSFSEGFSNAVAEAMACGVPCVVTDVGDQAQIVGDTGIVIEPRNPEALAEGWRLMKTRLANEGSALRERARLRIVGEFGRGQLIERTAAALESLF